MSELCYPDISVQLTHRRFRCVLDPLLALSPQGPEFARRLSRMAEIWLGTEFFNILDSAELYRRRPALLIGADAPFARSHALGGILRDWIRLRDEAATGGGKLHWIGDLLRESCLPAGMGEAVLPRWEAAARTLDACLPEAGETTGPLIAALRDTVALGAILPGAAILSVRAAPPGETPLLCRHMARWGNRFGCARLEPDDALVALERHGLRSLLIAAGLAQFVWSGLDLVVLHLYLPGTGMFETDAPLLDDTLDEPAAASGAYGPERPWDDARAFWYELMPEPSHAP